MRTSNQSGIQPPSLPDPLPSGDLYSAVENAGALCADVEGMLFDGCDASGLAGSTLEFSNCRFERCRLTDWDFKRVSFVDCLFDHCDLSGLRLQNATFQRAAFSACRLTGTDLPDVALMNVLLDDCTADYFTLTGSKCNHVRFRSCRFRESIWQDVALSDVAFDLCDFTAAELRSVALSGQNMTTCVLDSIRIDPRDLRGMKVSPLQGLMFCRLLGLEIVES